MEISMDDPDLISLSSISDFTEHSSDSNLSFHSSAVMLAQTNNNVCQTTRKGLGATAPSKKNNKTKSKTVDVKKPVKKPVKKEPVNDIPPPHEEVEEVAAPAIVNDPIAEATMSN